MKMAKEKKAKKIKQEKYRSEEQTEIIRFIRILIIVIIFVLAIYFLTRIFVTKDLLNDDNKEQETITGTINYNVTSIVDKQMYERLTISQYSIIYNNIMPYKQEKEVYHIIYDTSNNSFVQSNIGSVQVVYDLYSYLFKDDLAKIVNTDQEVLKNKAEFHERTYSPLFVKTS